MRIIDLLRFSALLATGLPARVAALLAALGLAPIFGGTDTNFPTGDAATVKRWATRLTIELPKEIYFGKWMKENDRNTIIEVKTDLDGQPGDSVSFTLLRKLTGAGVTDDGTLEGNEEGQNYFTDSVVLTQRRNAVRLAGRMSERRTAFDQRMGAKEQLKSWLAELIDSFQFTQFDTSPTVTIFGGDAVSTATVDAGDKFTPSLIDKAIAKAKKVLPKIWPVRVNGRDYYVMLVHTDVGYDLKRDGEWQQTQREANVRDGMDNPIFSGALGFWGGAVIHEHENVPTATTWGAGGNQPGASNMFFGRQAGVFGWGSRPEAWEKEFDYGAKVGFAIGAIWAMKKAVYNGADNAYISVKTYRTNN